jgi:maltose O-acetyltransferase
MTELFSRQIRKLKTEGFRWLAQQLEAARKPEISAILGPGAILGPESVIRNNYGGKDRVNVGAHSYVRGRLLVYGHGGCISIGEWCYVGIRTEIWSMNSITIGNRVLIAHDVNIHDGSAHSFDVSERHQHFRHIMEKGHPRHSEELPGVSSAPIVIEDDAWISFGVTILQGVRIGAGSIIAAGSMVTKDVPPGMLYRCEIKPVLSPLSLER